MAQLVALAGEEGAALEARAAARFLQEWIEEHGVTDDSSSKTKAPEEEQEVEDRAHGIVALHTIEEAAAFPPTRRALCGGATARPNAHMVALAGYVLRAITRSSAGPVPHAETALVALKALTALLTAWRLESSAPCSSLVAALHQRQAGVVPALVEASAALLRSAALPYEVKNQAGLVLVLAALDSADGNDDDAGLAQALAACFLSSSGGSAGLLAQLHPSLRGLPAALAPILHTSTSTSTSVASEAGLALARAVLVATDQGVLTAALPPALPLQYDASVAAGGTLMGGACEFVFVCVDGRAKPLRLRTKRKPNRTSHKPLPLPPPQAPSSPSSSRSASPRCPRPASWPSLPSRHGSAAPSTSAAAPPPPRTSLGRLPSRRCSPRPPTCCSGTGRQATRRVRACVCIQRGECGHDVVYSFMLPTIMPRQWRPSSRRPSSGSCSCCRPWRSSRSSRRKAAPWLVAVGPFRSPSPASPPCSGSRPRRGAWEVVRIWIHRHQDHPSLT